MLKLSGVETYYWESYILRGISMEVPEGAVVALLGRNGMGKTTAIRSIVGLTPPRRGIITLREKDITGLPPHKIAHMGVGLVPQGRHIFPSLTVEENLTASARNSGQPGAWTLDRVYSFFPVLKKRAGYRGNLLSGGEQQMLAIGRALMTNPELLLMDEPSEGLAPIMVLELGRIIAQLKESRFYIILVEQNVTMALAVADYVYVINRGEIVLETTPEALRDNEDLKNRYLGVAR
ncbi:MAG: ABC transporter ATP-binding protein [Syntrophorhabdales bacterium]